MLKGEIQRKTMQLPGQIVEEKKQQQHSEMDAISKSVTISFFFFCARALDIGDQWRRVVVLVPHVRREKKTTTN
jgi:hypothetical protein